jgi:hypothetical protein
LVRRRAALRANIAFLAAAVIVIIAVGYADLVMPTSQSTQSATTSSDSASASETVNGGAVSLASGISPDGLQLRMTLNSSVIQAREAITAQIEVVNTLDGNASVLGIVQNQNVSAWGGYSGLAFCPSNSILGYALFRGDFSSANLSEAGAPLSLTPLIISSCGPAISGPSALTFLPDGNQYVESHNHGQSSQSAYPAQLNATTLFCDPFYFGSGAMSCQWARPGLIGYWNYSIPDQNDLNLTSPAFAYFPRGDYTLVAADDWNQYLYATFVVS